MLDLGDGNENGAHRHLLKQERMGKLEEEADGYCRIYPATPEDVADGMFQATQLEIQELAALLRINDHLEAGSLLAKIIHRTRVAEYIEKREPA